MQLPNFLDFFRNIVNNSRPDSMKQVIKGPTALPDLQYTDSTESNRLRSLQSPTPVASPVTAALRDKAIQTVSPQLSPSPIAPVPSPSHDPLLKQPLEKYRQGKQLRPQKVPDDLRQAVIEAEAKTGVPAALIYNLAQTETGLQNIREKNNPKGGGRGYFQLDLTQQKGLKEEQAFDPKFAAQFAAEKLKRDIERLGFEKGIRQYNGNPHDVPAGKTAAERKRQLQAQAKTRIYLKRFIDNLTTMNYE